MTDRLSKIRTLTDLEELNGFQQAVGWYGPPLTEEERQALALRRAEIMKGAGK